MSGHRCQWDSIDAIGAEYAALPPDLTPGGLPDRPACWRVETGIGARQQDTSGTSPVHNWLCTRPVGHTGRHAAGDNVKVRAVW